MRRLHLLGSLLLLLLALAVANSNCLQDEEAGSPETPAAGTSPSGPEATSSKATTTTTTTTTTSTTSTTSKPPAGSTSTRRPAPYEADCPTRCTCSEREVNCEGRGLAQVPETLATSSFVEFRFARNQLEQLNLRAFPRDSAELIDVSSNRIRLVVAPSSAKSSKSTFYKLKRLKLRDNKLESLAGLDSWTMPRLEALSLAQNELRRLNASAFVYKTSLTQLDLSANANLRALDERSLVPLARLNALNLSYNPQLETLSEQLFASNGQLAVLDLSATNQLEVPRALRKAANLEELLLNENPKLTSLRPSDFVGEFGVKLRRLEVSRCEGLLRVEPRTFGALPELRWLAVANNRRLIEFDPTALGLDQQPFPKLQHLDLSYNNMSSMQKPVGNLMVQELRLAGNPWHCSCELEWLAEAALQPLHCRTPAKFRDLELSQFFALHAACNQPNEPALLENGLVLLMLLFLVLLAVAVFAQKANFCRRRDQYGTIYYTKASFPATEQA